MNKEELLRALSIKINSGEISREEVASRFGVVGGAGSGKGTLSEKISNFSATKMLYVLGAVIVVVGVIILIGLVWHDIGTPGRILITLGLGLVMAGAGSVLLKQKPDEHIGSVFHAIAGFLIPGGAVVALTEYYPNLSSVMPVAVTFCVIFAFYIILNLVHKNIVLTLFSIINGTASIYLLTSAIIENSQSFWYDNLFAHLSMLIGISYLLLAFSFRDTWNKKLSAVLFFVGSSIFYIAAFSQIFDSGVWRALYVVLVLCGLAIAVWVRSGLVLIVCTLALISYVSYITGKYFADSLGWPVVLVILGFVFIGLGYASASINKKYIK